MLARLLPKICRCNFFASGLVASFVAGLAVLGGGCASYGPRSLVIRPSALPSLMTVGNTGTIDLRIVSFNVWGLPGWMNGASADRYPRIAQQLEQLQPDLVLLQEVWTRKARAASP